MSRAPSLEAYIHFDRRGRGGPKSVCKAQPSPPSRPTGRVPRISRFMALAIRFEHLIRAGKVSDYADLARLGHVTRARITQIMNLLLLAPDLQEQLLFLPRVEAGDDGIYLCHLQPITAVCDWRRQRRLWKTLPASFAIGAPSGMQND
jgi:hypothetical protein